ncbi:MAG: hypothetical protein WC501_05710 [Candidatus Micrarchaeia archaeon]
MYTTIKISHKLKQNLDSMKIVDGETYEDLIKSLIEDHLTINENTQKQIEKSRKEVREGKIISFENLRKKAGLDV